MGDAAPNGASMRPNSPYQQRFAATTKTANVLVYCVPAGMDIYILDLQRNVEG